MILGNIINTNRKKKKDNNYLYVVNKHEECHGKNNG